MLYFNVNRTMNRFIKNMEETINYVTKKLHDFDYELQKMDKKENSNETKS